MSNIKEALLLMHDHATIQASIKIQDHPDAKTEDSHAGLSDREPKT